MFKSVAKHFLTLGALLIALTGSAFAGNPHVVLSTTKGDIELELDAEKAPVSVENFLGYVNSGFYDNTIFHRVIPGFMVQGGGMTDAMERKATQAPIKNEADNGVKNTKYTVAMARTNQINSATSQFFINVADNSFLDHGSRDFGYAVFGKVVKGHEIVDAIEKVKTSNNGHHQDVPVDAVYINSVRLLP